MRLLAAAILALVCVIAFFITFAEQPYYHSGISITLKDNGYHLQKVVRGSPAELAGLKAGIILAKVDGVDAVSLNKVSDADMAAFLTISTRFFKLGKIFTAMDSEGNGYAFKVGRLSWAERFPLLNATVLLNVLVGMLFIAFGIWLLLIGPADRAVKWFLLFSSFTGLALSVSYFSSYWTPFLLTVRFIVLDFAAVAACIFLVFFSRRFPVPREKAIDKRLAFSAALLPIGIKYALVATGTLSLFGPASFFIHIYVFLALAYAVCYLAIRYGRLKAKDKRKLRWVIAGAALSLCPYLPYLLTLIMRLDMLSSDVPILNYIATCAILFFPMFVAIGVVRYNLFDIDRFVNRIVVVFFLALIATGAYFVVFVAILDTRLTASMYFGLLFSVLLSPLLYNGVNRAVERIVWLGKKEKLEILSRMETGLVGVFKTPEVYEIVSKAMANAFDPGFVAFLSEKSDGSIEVDAAWPDAGATRGATRKDRLDRLGKGSTRSHEDGSLSLRLLGQRDKRVLELGPVKGDDIYTKEDVSAISGSIAQISKALENCDLYQRLQESLMNETNAQRTAILSLAKLTEYRDHETGRHLERIREYSRLLALKLRETDNGNAYLTDAYIDDLGLSSVLHDIGKVGIPDQVLLKPGKLTEEEFEVIKKHPSIGGKILEETELLNPTRSFLAIGKLVAYHHHEKWDGSGYPFGLSGEDIPLSARIVAVCDVYDALISARPYKDALSHEAATAIIRKGRGTHFDPKLVDVFIAAQEDFRKIGKSG